MCIIFWDAPPTIVATAQESCTMRHFQPFLCQWCPPQCQTCHICQNLSKMKVQHLENKCQNWSKLGAYLKTDKSIPVYFQTSISKAKKILPINLNLKCKSRLGPCHFLIPYVDPLSINRSSRRKRGMASNPLFIIPDFFCILLMNFAMATFFPTFPKEFSHFLQT